MKFQVTQKMIDEGKPKDCSNCPVALAIKEKIPNGIIGIGWLSDNYDGSPSIFINGLKYPIPQDVSFFVHKFDNFTRRHLAKPFEFELNI